MSHVPTKRLSRTDAGEVEYETSHLPTLTRIHRSSPKRKKGPTAMAPILGGGVSKGDAVSRMWATFERSLEDWRTAVYKNA